MEQVIIGVDPHKLSATIEVVDQHERFLGSGRFTTDQAGYAAMRKYAKTWPARVWAVEGANGTGRPLAQRLLEAGEEVVDVPAERRAATCVAWEATWRGYLRVRPSRSALGHPPRDETRTVSSRVSELVSDLGPGCGGGVPFEQASVQTLETGTRIDRYGGEGGHFLDR
jgi:hypothetical protein